MDTLLDTQGLQAVGWAGFLDVNYMLESLASLLLATALAALIAFHPTTRKTIDTAEEAELPKVHLTYALIGAIVGITVLQYGLVIGFVIFGIGGLIRISTETETSRDTGRLIITTLIGLICGLNLPHFAVLATLFTWVLIYIFDASPVCTINVHDVPKGQLKTAAIAYRALLKELNCHVINEHKAYGKNRLDYVFRMPRRATQEHLHQQLCERPPIELRGDIEWKLARGR